MARTKKGNRVIGPYRHKDRWRIVTIGADGSRASQSFATKEEAEDVIRDCSALLCGQRSVDDCVHEYKQDLIMRGLKKNSILSAVRKVEFFVGNRCAMLSDITTEEIARMYYERAKVVSPATHRRELRAMRTFISWCKERGYVDSNLSVNVKPIGQESAGKEQLRFSEAAKFYETCLSRASWDDGALAAACCLSMGLRSDEIRSRTVRDVDFDGGSVVLWIPGGKTRNARRHLAVPEPLGAILMGKCGGRSATDYIFPSYSGEGYKTANWLLCEVKRLCKLAGVPEVCVHGLRGTFATIASERGVATTAVAKELGHGSYKMTEKHYAAPGALQRAQVEMAAAMLNRFPGGKKPSESFPGDKIESPSIGEERSFLNFVTPSGLGLFSEIN